MNIGFSKWNQNCYQQIYFIPVMIMKTGAYVTGKERRKKKCKRKERKRKWTTSQGKPISNQEKLFL